MAKEAIEKIRAAEAEAQRILENIPLKVKQVLDEAEEARQTLCNAAEAETTADTEAQLAQMRERADQLLQRSADEAQAEAKEMQKAAESGMSDAVKLVVGAEYLLEKRVGVGHNKIQTQGKHGSTAKEDK